MQSLPSRRYLDPQRNKENFEYLLNHVDSDTKENVVGFLPQLNQALGELKDIVWERRKNFNHLHHPVDNLLSAVMRGRSQLAKVLVEQRRSRSSS